MVFPFLLGCVSILFANASIRAHEAIPVCRYRDLTPLYHKTQVYTVLAVTLGLAPVFLTPWGVIISLASIGYMAYRRFA